MVTAQGLQSIGAAAINVRLPEGRPRSDGFCRTVSAAHAHGGGQPQPHIGSMARLPSTNIRETANVALLLIDVVNDLAFDGGEDLREPALAAARQLAKLKRRARRLGIPCIYVNDNFGHWRSDFRAQVARCLRAGVRGRSIVRLLIPQAPDYFVLKPHRSGFFSTPLGPLLETLGTKRLILTGLTGDMCVLHTAAEAVIRGFELFVPQDCCASETAVANRQALDLMERTLKANVTPSDELDLAALLIVSKRRASSRSAGR